MDTDNLNSGTVPDFSFRILALCIVFLVASRVAMGWVYEFISNGNWLAGISGGILASLLAYWLYTIAVDSPSEE